MFNDEVKKAITATAPGDAFIFYDIKASCIADDHIRTLATMTLIVQ